MEKRIAIVIGASGATGRELVSQLLKNEMWCKVKLFVRTPTGLHSSKLEENCVDFDKMDTWKEKIVGDDLFSALGTTIKLAKTKENQYRIDFSYQFQVAKFAAENNVKNYALVSAYGANSKSLLFYSRIKGELENAVKTIPFDYIHIFKPGLLDRKMNDNRLMEKISLKLIQFFNKIGLFKSQKPLDVKILASKMIHVVNFNKLNRINYYKLNEIFKI
jgi:hypothetical protein